jgi:small conductance mechanosensitive channel
MDKYFPKIDEITTMVLNNLIEFIPSLLVSLLIFCIFWRCSYLIARIISGIGTKSDINPALVHLMSKIGWITVFIFGLVTSLNNLGINLTALTASLGLTGFALSFALKDAISNLVAGVMVILYRTFRKGDYIEVAGDKGIVLEVNLRYTVIEPEKKDVLIYIPNSILLSKQITVNKKLSIASTDENDGYVLK